MRLLIATDAWHPQINGVVRSLEHMAAEAPIFGAEVFFLTPDRFRSVPMPTYREIRLSLATPGAVMRHLQAVAPSHVHIATEGPIGFATRRACLREGRAFTTSYHTRFPEYLSARAPVPESWTYLVLRRFHNSGCATMVSTPSLEAELRERGFRNVVRWTRGVDTELFRPRADAALEAPSASCGKVDPVFRWRGPSVRAERGALLEREHRIDPKSGVHSWVRCSRPIFLYVGRVAVEKNLEAFLSLDLPGTKVVVGDGPARAPLEARYPAVRFLGPFSGEPLAHIYSAADVFVFPSLTDTFGIVLLEALASGLPVAAYPVTGPIDVIGTSGCGVLDHDLRKAALAALDIPRARCRAFGEGFTWRESARQFFSNIEAAHVRAHAATPGGDAAVAVT